MENSNLGKFYGISVGPGDPDMMTLQALKAIECCDVLILPAKDKEGCRAYNIAKGAVNAIELKECIFMPFPMKMEADKLSLFHDEAASVIEEKLVKGKNVGFLTIGDVSIYSTFEYIKRLIVKKGFHTKSISGVTSFCASAAAANVSLGLGNEEIHIIPGSADIEQAFKLSGTLVFMKSGKKLATLIEYMKANIDLEKTVIKAVSNCGMADEIIGNCIEDINTESGYLTVVIVRRETGN